MHICLIFAKSADPDEMPHYATFHRGLHCLPKYPFAGIDNEKGWKKTFCGFPWVVTSTRPGGFMVCVCIL